jgi:hypothetical protein
VLIDARAKLFAKSIPEPNTGCWLWDGALSANRYGSVSFRGCVCRAHRLSYEAFVGPIPDGMHVLHKCDVPSCVNPDHLFVGTHQDNMDDRGAKGRGNNCKGREHGKAKLTDDAVRDIRSRRMSVREYMVLYGVSEPTVRQVLRREVWKHVD